MTSSEIYPGERISVNFTRKKRNEWTYWSLILERIESSRRKKPDDKTRILANAVESSDDAITTSSLDGTITSWNRGAEKMYGYSAKEILGNPLSVLEPAALSDETEELAELVSSD